MTRFLAPKHTMMMLMATLLTVVSAPSMAFAENTRATNPSALSAEVLGRAGTWSINFDHAVDDHLAAGIGFGSISTKVLGVSAGTVGAIPVYVNYYFVPEQGSIFATGGATVFTESVSGLKASTGGFDLSGQVMASAGVGYENRTDQGFLFRIAGYALIADEIAPWGGFTIGYSF